MIKLIQLTKTGVNYHSTKTHSNIICASGLHEFFELPEKHGRLWLKISDKPFADGYKVEQLGGSLIAVQHRTGYSGFYIVYKDFTRLMFSNPCYIGVTYEDLK